MPDVVKASLRPVQIKPGSQQVPLIILRSVIFQIVFFSNCVFWFLFASLAWLMPSGAMMWMARVWGVSTMYLHELITGARVVIRGTERIAEGPILVAAKHQSAWETMGLIPFFPRPTYIFKRELLYVPLFGWHMLKAQQVPIDRGDRASAMNSIRRGVQRAIAAGAHIIIFPEGTRRKVGAAPAYRFGVARIYEAAGRSCQPVAILSGRAWPRNTLLHYPREIVMEFLDPIPADLPSTEFFRILETRIEAGMDRLMAEVGEAPATRD